MFRLSVRSGLSLSSAELELEEGLFLYERGLELVEREDWHEALSRFEMALHIFERVGTELEVSLCLKALGKIYGFLGRWLRAAECFEKDLEIQKRLGNEQELLEDIDHLVTYYTRSCDFEKAASQLERVHNVFQRSGNQEGVIRVQTYLGQTFENMGNLEKALSHYRMAFEVGEKLDSPSTVKLDTKIRELTELKTGGKERAPLKAAGVTLRDSTPLEEPPGLRVRRVGGVQVEPQTSDIAGVVGELEEKGKKLFSVEGEEGKFARGVEWVPSRVVPREELELLLEVRYDEFMEVNREQFLRVVVCGLSRSSEETEPTKGSLKEGGEVSSVEVLVLAPDFDVEEPRRRLDSSTEGLGVLQFGLTPRVVGRQRVSLEFYHLGRMVRRAVVPVFVKENVEEKTGAQRSVEIPLRSEEELDATLRIHRIRDRFYFHLFSRYAEELASRGKIYGASDLDDVISERLRLQMKNLSFDGDHPKRMITILTEIGRKAYGLIPKGIRDALSFLNPRFLIIETNDLFVPFELAYDGEDFLCLKYCVGKRILAENRDFRAPPTRIGRGKMRTRLIVAEPETAIIREKEFLKRVDASGLLNLETVENASAQSFNAALSEGADIIHIRCGGVFNEREPGETKLLLSDGLYDLREIDQRVLGENPLVFAYIHEEKSTGGGTGVRGFMGMGSVAKAFLSSGASAFVGHLLKIPGHIASEIAIKFYEKVIPNGKPLGVIIREIKKELKQKYPGVVWATLNLYGDPTIKIIPRGE